MLSPNFLNIELMEIFQTLHKQKDQNATFILMKQRLDLVNFSREAVLGTHGLMDPMKVRLVSNDRNGGLRKLGTNVWKILGLVFHILEMQY